MSVTKRQIFMMFMRGQALESMQHHYAVTWEWLESALRKYMGRAFK